MTRFEGGKPAASGDESTWTRFHRFLSSSRFALFLLLTIGCVSLLGMFVIQGAPSEQYGLRYGRFWGDFIRLTGIGNVYRVWWFVLLVCLLVANLILCSARRAGHSLRQAFTGPRAEDHPLLGSAKARPVGFEPIEVVDRLSLELRRRGYAVGCHEPGGGRTGQEWGKRRRHRHIPGQPRHVQFVFIAAQKGSISRVGFLVTHLAVILVLLAGMVGGLFGVRAERSLSIGETFDAEEISPSADFGVRVDDFVIETTPEGRIRDYKSTLTVVEQGHEVFTKVIEVNHPLTHKGVGVYQSSYGEEPDRIKEARLYLVEGDSVLSVVDVPFGKVARVPGTDMEVALTGFVPDFVMDLSTGVVSTRSSEPNLPAVRLEVVRDGAVVDGGWVLLHMESHSSNRELSRFHFVGYYPAFYTGLSFTVNRGISLLLSAFVLAGVGIFLSFFVPFERIWIGIARGRPTGALVRIAGASSRSPMGMERTIESFHALAAGK
ncbi:MAG: cytochrome c biogenesis protein ResB [Candidatus Eisenbacteria bacterium]